MAFSLARVPWAAAIASLVSIISCGLFAFFFHKAMNGFSRQVNAFVSVGDFAFPLVLSVLAILTTAFVVYLLFVAFVAAERGEDPNCCSRLFSSWAVLGLSTVTSYSFIVGWTLILCIVSSFTLVYFIFIGAIFSFCGLLNQQCFDFKVLLPAIVEKISNKKVDLTMCAEKEELLCAAHNNQIWTFLYAFVFCLLTFAGLLIVENCISSRWATGSPTRTRKGEHYAMNASTVDSHSFVMKTLEK